MLMEKWICACVVFDKAAAAKTVAAKRSFFILEVFKLLPSTGKVSAKRCERTVNRRHSAWRGGAASELLTGAFFLRTVLNDNQIGDIYRYRNEPHLHDGLFPADLANGAHLVVLLHHHLIAYLRIPSDLGIFGVELPADFFIHLFFLL
jgi:hypothetical protein